MTEGAFRKVGLGKQQLVVLVHSGSRGLGESILRAHVAQHFSDALEAESFAAEAYLRDHDVAVRWAKANRELIARRFGATLGAEAECLWDGCHNSITPSSTQRRSTPWAPLAHRNLPRRDIKSSWILFYMRSGIHDVLPVGLRRSLAKFGHDLAVARRKRHLTVAMMAQRTGLAKSTYARLEKGDPAVTLGAYAMTLFVLGFGETFGTLTDASSDEEGLLLDEERLPKRVRMKKTPTPL